MQAILKLKDGSVMKHNIDNPDQINIIDLSFGKIIRIAPIDSDNALYYDFNILDKIDCE